MKYLQPALHPSDTINIVKASLIFDCDMFSVERIEDLDYFLEGHSINEGKNRVNRCTCKLTQFCNQVFRQTCLIQTIWMTNIPVKQKPTHIATQR
jgi:hypothetical protein